MSHTTPSNRVRYGLAVLLFWMAAGLEHTINFHNDPEATPIFFILGSLLSAWFGGMGPGLLTTALSILACDFFYLTPKQFLRNGFHENLWLISMALSGMLFSVLCGLRARHMARLRVRARQQQTVARFGNMALEGTDPAELMREAVSQTAHVLQVRHVLIVQPSEERRSLMLKAQVGWEPPLEGTELPIPADGETLATVTMRSQQPLLSNDLQRDPRFANCQAALALGLNGAISALIRSQDRDWGVMEAYSPRRRHFTQEDLHFLQSMAQTLALALERHEAEAQRLSLARHQELLLESTDQGIYGIDLNGAITFVNRSAAEMLGHAPEALPGRNAHALFHHHKPDGAPYPNEECPIQTTLRQGQGRRIEEEVYWRRDGSCLPVEYSSHPVFKDGALNGAVVTFSDISQRKQAERERAALLQSVDTQRQLFQAVADNAPVGIMILRGEDLAAKWCNVAYTFFLEEPFHGKPEEVRGRTLAEFIPDAAESGLVEIFHSVTASGRPYVNHEYEFHGFQRGVTYWHWTLTPLPGGDGAADLMLLAMDITENVLARKRIETLAAQAQASLHQLQAIVSSMNEGIIIADSDGQILLMNPAALRMHGCFDPLERPLDLAALASSFELRTMAGDLIPAEWHPLARLLGGETFSDIEIQVRNMRSAQYWIANCNGSSVRNAEGKAVLAVLTLRDVTLQKESEAERRRLLKQIASERARLNAIFDNAPEAIVVVDEECRIVMANPVAEILLERPIPMGEEYESHAELGLCHAHGEPIEPRALPLTRSVLDGEVIGNAELAVELPDGRRRAILMNAAPTYDTQGKVSGAIAVFQDVTASKEVERERQRLLTRIQEASRELKEANQRLEAQRAQLEAFLQNLPAGVMIAEAPSGRITVVNQQMLALMAQPPTVAESIEDYSRQALFHPDGRIYETEEYPLARTLRNGELISGEEIGIVRPDGSSGVVRISSTPLRDHKGEIIAAIATVFDITETLRLQGELSQRAEELTQLNHAKDEFLAMLAHELRNPLAPIVNAIHIIKRNGNCARDAGLQRSAEMIERQTRHMARLLDDLLDVARITSGKIALQQEPLELSAIARQAAESCRATIEANRHTLTLKLAEQPLSVEADPARLEQVAANLLNNAAKYTPKGGLIELETKVEEGLATLSVRDNGIGIAPEMLPRVFELFSQAAPTMDRAQGGLGIGLTIVKRLVELHGGRVEARSEGLGQGCEFIVRLPFRAEAKPTPQAAPQAAEPEEKGEPLRVLIVEDNYDTALAMSEVIEIWGHEVRLAYDGSSAVEMARLYQPDVMLLDIGLPELDGFQVAGTLRRDPRFSGTVMIAITGYGQEEDVRRSQEAGINHHFTKPVNLGMLQEILNNLHHRDD